MAGPHHSRGNLGVLLVGVARRWRAMLDASLAVVGLSDATWSPLAHIGRSGGGICQKDLAARVGIDGSSLVRLLDILAKKGLIERRQDVADRRSNLLYLTPAGRAAEQGIMRVLTVVEQQMLADLDDVEIARMMGALEQIDRRIKALRSGERQS